MPHFYNIYATSFINKSFHHHTIQRVIYEVLEGFNENEIVIMRLIDLHKSFDGSKQVWSQAWVMVILGYIYIYIYIYDGTSIESYTSINLYIKRSIYLSRLLISRWRTADPLFIRDKCIMSSQKRWHVGYVQKAEAHTKHKVNNTCVWFNGQLTDIYKTTTLTPQFTFRRF